MSLWVFVVGLLLNAIALPVAGLRVLWLYRLITSGQPDPSRASKPVRQLGVTIKNQLVEVLGQQRLLKWTIPGAAHAFVMYAFLILATVYLEAYGILLSRNSRWAIPLVGHWAILGFAQDFIAVMCLLGLVVFAIIRVKNSPERLGRKSRFKGSHLGGAWLVLIMIFNVIWTMLLFRGAASAADNFPYKSGAFASIGIGKVLDGLSESNLELLEHVGLLLHIGVMLVFLILVLNSKHLHIFIAPLNVAFKRDPVALGAAKPMMSQGKVLDLENMDDIDLDAGDVMGIGKVEDFTWKGMLDFASCTECGRCQSQCPAWNTEKPLSPKMLIMNLRDHAFAKAPYIMAGSDEERANLPADVLAEAERPLVGETEGEPWHPTGGAVIDTDVLWSCTSCGACVQQCPVDIEHVDHIIDMRRHQVLVESSFPAELNVLFKGLENKGNPWNMSPNARMDWAKDLPFDVKVVGEDLESLDSVDWLFWVGCAGAYEDRAKKTTRAVAELLDTAGVTFGVLGNGETCTGDPARRAGNEFVYQGLAAQNIETLTEFKVKKVVTTCPHCLNTLKNEYKQLGVELEVVHHTQLLNRLVREGKLTPVADGAGAASRSITYHDPCYLGRHNQVYEPPRELLQVMPGAQVVEMERSGERSFCCGAGGARMWMEETIGERVNTNRTREAVGTGADQIAVGCPFCRVMLSDGLTELQDSGSAREEVEVLDVAQMLLASVKGEVATRQRAAASSTSGAASAVATAAEPKAGDATITEDTVVATEDVGPAAKASGGSSLFDTPAPAEEKPAAPAEEKPAGGSLFDTPAPTEEKPATEKPADEKPAEEAGPAEAGGAEAEATATPAPSEDLGGGGSLFDVGPAETAAPAGAADKAPAAEEKPVEEKPAEEAEAAEAEAPAAPAPTADLGGGGSLFDIEAPAEAPAAAAPAAEEPAAEEPEAAAEEPPAEEPVAEEPETATDEPAAEEPEAAADEPEAAADEPAVEEPAAEEPAIEKPAADAKPAASGETNTPKTDVDINKSGSLFDL